MLASDGEFVRESLNLEGEVLGSLVVGEGVTIRLKAGNELVDVLLVDLVLSKQALNKRLQRKEHVSVATTLNYVGLQPE